MSIAKEWLLQIGYDPTKPHTVEETALLIEQYLLEVFIPNMLTVERPEPLILNEGMASIHIDNGFLKHGHPDHICGPRCTK